VKHQTVRQAGRQIGRQKKNHYGIFRARDCHKNDILAVIQRGNSEENERVFGIKESIKTIDDNRALELFRGMANGRIRKPSGRKKL